MAKNVRKTIEELPTFEAADYLTSKEAIEIFMAEALETKDAAYMAHALGVVARAKGMTGYGQS